MPVSTTRSAADNVMSASIPSRAVSDEYSPISSASCSAYSAHPAGAVGRILGTRQHLPARVKRVTRVAAQVLEQSRDIARLEGPDGDDAHLRLQHHDRRLAEPLNGIGTHREAGRGANARLVA